MKKIILASASPRRQELLKQIGLDFEVRFKPVDETFPAHMTPEEAVCEIACKKAHSIACDGQEGIIIGADTVVVHNGIILGKPSNASEAAETLRRLSGTDHLVITGFCVLEAVTGKVIKASETTRVFFRGLADYEVTAYVNSGEPVDKAGSYGIQGLGAVLVNRIEGCYFNVVGLPLTKLVLALREFGVIVLS